MQLHLVAEASALLRPQLVRAIPLAAVAGLSERSPRLEWGWTVHRGKADAPSVELTRVPAGRGVVVEVLKVNSLVVHVSTQVEALGL